tara:strand:+ start:421 stop:789 length:369 start_codon:yes stop_codon:yes gene_type:complete
MNNKLRAYTEAAQALLTGQNYAIICQLNSDGSVTFKDFGEGITAPSQSELDAKASEIDATYPFEVLRTKRNQLLAETDYLGNSDVTMSTAWKTYRQALRDLPANQTPADMELSNITWPTKPS